MADHDEIEVKFYLGDPQAMRASLLRLGAASEGRHFETNIRFEDAVRSLGACGVVLRLRRAEACEGDAAQPGVRQILTYKEPSAEHDPNFRIRRELEVEVGDIGTVQQILERLGFEPSWIYEKRRETFHIEGAEVVIDETPLGWFMEIEGAREQIRRAAGALGLDMADAITLSYAQLFRNVRRALGLNIRDMTFDAFRDVSVGYDDLLLGADT
jgi:adenylate cyclase class 2